MSFAAVSRRRASHPGRVSGWLAAVLAILLGFSAATSRGASAQEGWPNRPIRLVVPFPPGGVTDGIARISADWLSRRLGVPVVVDNHPGANGVMAAQVVSRSEPDGYTLLTASASQMVMLPAVQPKLPVNMATDFAPVSIMASNPMVLGVSAKTGVSTLQQLLALEKEKERAGTQLDYGSTGNGSSPHLAMALLMQRTGINMQHIPYRGSASVMQAIASGDIAAFFGNTSDMIPFADNSGLVRVLAVGGRERLPSLPNVPTLAEAGLQGVDVETWNGVAAPAGTPAEIVARLSRELQAACGDADLRAALERLGTTPVCSSGEAFGARMRAEEQMWREVVRVAGIKPS